MTSLETLECKRYVAEGRMFQAEASLGRHLSTIEQRVSRLAGKIDGLVHRSGRMPLDEKTFRIINEIQAVTGALDLTEARELASRIAELKAEISVCEKAITAQMTGRTSQEGFDQHATEAA